MNYNEIKPLVIEWAKGKNLTDSGKQYIKVFEEIGELASAILKNDLPEIKDAIGDIAVTLIIHGWQTNTDYDHDYHVVVDECITVSELFKDFLDMVIHNNQHSLMYLNEIAHEYNTDLDECLLLAWNVIKNRTGKTVNGTFIKD